MTTFRSGSLSHLGGRDGERVLSRSHANRSGAFAFALGYHIGRLHTPNRFASSHFMQICSRFFRRRMRVSRKARRLQFQTSAHSICGTFGCSTTMNCRETKNAFPRSDPGAISCNCKSKNGAIRHRGFELATSSSRDEARNGPYI